MSTLSNAANQSDLLANPDRQSLRAAELGAKEARAIGRWIPTARHWPLSTILLGIAYYKKQIPSRVRVHISYLARCSISRQVIFPGGITHAYNYDQACTWRVVRRFQAVTCLAAVPCSPTPISRYLDQYENYVARHICPIASAAVFADRRLITAPVGPL